MIRVITIQLKDEGCMVKGLLALLLFHLGTKWYQCTASFRETIRVIIRHNPARVLWFPDKVDTKLYFIGRMYRNSMLK